MNADCDVFAGLTDFCENYNPDDATKLGPQTDNLEHSKESDSDAENFFLQKSQRRKATKSKDPVRKEQKSLPTRGRKKKEAAPVEISIPDVTENVQVSPQRRVRRSTRRANRGTSIEAYMQAQTQQILAVPSASSTASNRSTSQRVRRPRRSNNQRVASDAPVLDVVDLAGPPTPPLPPRSLPKQQILVIDSDDECNYTFTGSFTGANNNSFDTENPEINVKVKWNETVELIPHRKHQKFADLMKVLAEKENASIQEILLDLNDRIIEPEDTPESIGYNVAQFIAGRVVRNADYIAPLRKKDPTMVKVKIQSNAFKKPLEVRMKREHNFKILYVMCSEELKIPCEQIKLSFDGEALDLTETPNDLEFEGGEVIDCRIKV